MAAKLKLISARIPWYSFLRSVVFGASWFFLPWWAFLLVALALYAVPFFAMRRMAGTFSLFLFLSFFITPGFVAAAGFVVAFFLIEGIKDLFFINRAGAYELLAALFLALGSMELYARFGAGDTGLFAAIVLFACVAALFKGFIGELGGSGRAIPLTIAPLAAFLLLQLSWVLFFLPLAPLAAAFVLVACGVIGMELLGRFVRGHLDRRAILISLFYMLAISAFALASAPWTL